MNGIPNAVNFIGFSQAGFFPKDRRPRMLDDHIPTPEPESEPEPEPEPLPEPVPYEIALCAWCNKPIYGRCVTAMFRKFHPECFLCSFCLKPLKLGTFKSKDDKPFCQPCFNRLFGYYN